MKEKDVTDEYTRVYDIIDSIFRGKNVATHVIWDSIAGMLVGYNSVSHTDVIGVLQTKISGFNSGHDMYLPGEHEKYQQELADLNDSHPAKAFHAREKKQRVTEIQTWLDEYDTFVRQYALGKDDMSIGTAWKEIVLLERWDRIKELADAFMILRNEIIPYAKREITMWYKTNAPEMIIDVTLCEKSYRDIRGLMKSMYTYLMKSRINRESPNFIKDVRYFSHNTVNFTYYDYPLEWNVNDFNLMVSAMCFAEHAHNGATRKGTKIPYIMHPIEAGMITMSLTDDVSVVVAAILHDVVEDTKYDLGDIEQRFGPDIAQLVSYESEDKMHDIPAANSWKLRKETFLKHLENAPLEAKIICLADKVSNMRLSAKTFKSKGDAMWQAFNQKDKSEQEWYYRSIYERISELENTDAYKEYVKLCDMVFA